MVHMGANGVGAADCTGVWKAVVHGVLSWSYYFLLMLDKARLLRALYSRILRSSQM